MKRRALCPHCNGTGEVPRPEQVVLVSPQNPVDLLVAALAPLEAYQALDVRACILRCEVWCQMNRKQMTKRRVVNWLNRDAADTITPKDSLRVARGHVEGEYPQGTNGRSQQSLNPVSEPPFHRPESPESLRELMARLKIPASHEAHAPARKPGTRAFGLPPVDPIVRRELGA